MRNPHGFLIAFSFAVLVHATAHASHAERILPDQITVESGSLVVAAKHGLVFSNSSVWQNAAVQSAIPRYILAHRADLYEVVAFQSVAGATYDRSDGKFRGFDAALVILNDGRIGYGGKQTKMLLEFKNLLEFRKWSLHIRGTQFNGLLADFAQITDTHKNLPATGCPKEHVRIPSSDGSKELCHRKFSGGQFISVPEPAEGWNEGTVCRMNGMFEFPFVTDLRMKRKTLLQPSGEVERARILRLIEKEKICCIEPTDTLFTTYSLTCVDLGDGKFDTREYEGVEIQWDPYVDTVNEFHL